MRVAYSYSYFKNLSIQIIIKILWENEGENEWPLYNKIQVAIIFVSHKRPSKLRYASTYVIKLAIENAQMCT